MRDEWYNPRESLFIPGVPGHAKPEFIDAGAMREAPRDLIPSTGSATSNFDKVTGDLIVDFKDRLIDPLYIQRALRWARFEYGDAVTHLTLLICAEAMQEFILWLSAKGFERQPDKPQSAMYAWRVKLKQPQKRQSEERR